MGQPDICVVIVYWAIVSPSIPRVDNGVWPLFITHEAQACILLVKS